MLNIYYIRTDGQMVLRLISINRYPKPPLKLENIDVRNV